MKENDLAKIIYKAFENNGFCFVHKIWPDYLKPNNIRVTLANSNDEFCHLTREEEIQILHNIGSKIIQKYPNYKFIFRYWVNDEKITILESQPIQEVPPKNSSSDLQTMYYRGFPKVSKCVTDRSKNYYSITLTQLTTLLKRSSDYAYNVLIGKVYQLQN